MYLLYYLYIAGGSEIYPVALDSFSYCACLINFMGNVVHTCMACSLLCFYHQLSSTPLILFIPKGQVQKCEYTATYNCMAVQAYVRADILCFRQITDFIVSRFRSLYIFWFTCYNYHHFITSLRV